MSKDILQEKLAKIFEFIDINPEIKIDQEEEAFKINIKGDDLSFLIGYRGESLEALQYIIGHSLYKETNNWAPVTIDINGYRQQKLDKLDEMIKSYVDRVRFHQKEIRLPPLNAYERRHVHMLISEYIDVESESQGEGKDRRLYLKPAS